MQELTFAFPHFLQQYKIVHASEAQIKVQRIKRGEKNHTLKQREKHKPTKWGAKESCRTQVINQRILEQY